MFSRKRALFTLLITVFVVLLTGVSYAEKDTLIVGSQYDAKTLDPIATNDLATSGACMAIYEKLLIWDDLTGEIKPGLAEKWEQIDSKTYKFYLRKGVKFHNGETLKASDVKFTFERARGPLGGSVRTYVSSIETIEVLDDHTFIMKLNKVFTPLLVALSHTSGSIVNEKAVTEAGINYGMNPVGTGPFKMVSWTKGDRINLVRFEEYHGEKPKYKNLILRVVVEPVARVIELETGALDIAYYITPNDRFRVEENPKLTLLRKKDFSTHYVGINFARPPLDNPKVREAIYLALDTQGMQKAIYRGVGSLPTSQFPPSQRYFDESLKPHVQDIEKAKQLLKEAGVGKLKLELWTDEAYERVAAATMTQAQLAEVGIDVELKVFEWGAFMEGLKQKRQDLYTMSWTAAPDPDFSVAGVFHSSMIGGTNRSNVNDPELDAMIEQGAQMADGPEREALYHKIQNRIVNELRPWMYITNDELLVGTQKNVKGFHISPLGYHNVNEVYFE
ncbi:ABC transporter substrate-binding protein [Lactococcus petauri]